MRLKINWKCGDPDCEFVSHFVVDTGAKDEGDYEGWCSIDWESCDPQPRCPHHYDDSDFEYMEFVSQERAPDDTPITPDEDIWTACWTREQVTPEVQDSLGCPSWF